jgi:limonene-1,2-epoxide hydrolase
MNYYIMIFASGMYDYNNNKISVWNNYFTNLW